MSIEQTQVVDLVTTEYKTGDVLLSISDHLPWTSENGNHLLLLQEKLNSYLRFIETGEIFSRFPSTRGRRIVILILGRYPLNQDATNLIEHCKIAIASAGFELRFELLSPGQD